MKANAQNATVKTAVCTSENLPSLYLIYICLVIL